MNIYRKGHKSTKKQLLSLYKQTGNKTPFQFQTLSLSVINQNSNIYLRVLSIFKNFDKTLFNFQTKQNSLSLGLLNSKKKGKKKATSRVKNQIDNKQK